MNTLPGYYELEPEDNYFTDVTADVTHKCNMECSNCYVPNRDIPDMDIDKLIDVTKQVEGHTICAFGDAAAWPIQALVKHFRPEIEKRIKEYNRSKVF